MKIASFRVYSIEIPMRFGVTHSLTRREVSSNVIVCAVGNNEIVGFGECCPRVYVTGETIESVINELSVNILPPMVGKTFASFSSTVNYLTSAFATVKRNHQAAFCAAELAVLDLVGKAFLKSAGELIGPQVVTKKRYSSVIATGDPVKAGRLARAMRLFGFKDIKIKVGQLLDDNIEILEKVRSNAGTAMTLRIDANCAWRPEEAIRQLDEMQRFSLTAVEQPVPADDFEGMAMVTAAKMLDVVADESLCSIADAEKLIEMKACDVFNIRVSKCGGLINSAAIYRKAVEAGLSCQVGAQVGETAILSAAGRHLATRCKSIKWSEGSYGCLLLKHNISRDGMTIGLGGWGKSIDRSGLGVTPIEERIDKYKTNMIEIA